MKYTAHAPTPTLKVMEYLMQVMWSLVLYKKGNNCKNHRSSKRPFRPNVSLSDDFRPVVGKCFFPLLFYMQNEIHTQPLNPNPEDSNAINGPLRDYDDDTVMRRELLSLIQWHYTWTPSLERFWIMSKQSIRPLLFLVENWSIALHMSLGQNLLDVGDSEHPHVHTVMMMNGATS